MSVIGKIAAPLDAKRSLLNFIKDINPQFYADFINHILTDRITLSNFEKELVDAFYRIERITIGLNEEGKIFVQKKGEPDFTYDNYEDAINRAISYLK